MGMNVYGEVLTSRLILGTSQYPTLDALQGAILSSKTQVITVSLKRQSHSSPEKSDFWHMLKQLPVKFLPNTAGCHSAHEAIEMSNMAREIFDTQWIKLEVILDDQTLLPNAQELVKAAQVLIKDGFKVFPYCTDDISVCHQLVAAGVEVLMPLASPIGSGQGLRNPLGLSMLRNQFPKTTIIVDAGLGEPSDAAKVMQMGCDGVLLNSAIAYAGEPEKMAKAFAMAVQGGRLGYESGRMPYRQQAMQSTPLIDTPFWQYEEH